MSWESAEHVMLVELTASEIKRRHGQLYSLTLFVDLPSAGRNRPAIIRGYIPDVFAVDTPETCRIIGEAKTVADCETPRSMAQISAFLTHLACFPKSAFYLSVPYFYRARAETLLHAAVKDAHALSVVTHVIAGTQGNACP